MHGQFHHLDKADCENEAHYGGHNKDNTRTGMLLLLLIMIKNTTCRVASKQLLNECNHTSKKIDKSCISVSKRMCVCGTVG